LYDTMLYGLAKIKFYEIKLDFKRGIRMTVKRSLPLVWYKTRGKEERSL
jgi:hypothetical protein